jgi:hypothetical protein
LVCDIALLLVVPALLPGDWKLKPKRPRRREERRAASHTTGDNDHRRVCCILDAALRSVASSLRVSRAGDVVASAVRRFNLSGVALSKLRRKGGVVKGKMQGKCKEILHNNFGKISTGKHRAFKFHLTLLVQKFDSDFALMSLEMSKFIDAMIKAFGGESEIGPV